MSRENFQNFPFPDNPNDNVRFGGLRSALQRVGRKLTEEAARFQSSSTSETTAKGRLHKHEEQDTYKVVPVDAVMAFLAFLSLIFGGWLFDALLMGPILRELVRRSFGDIGSSADFIAAMVPAFVIATESGISMMRTLAGRERETYAGDSPKWLNWGVTGWTVAGVVLGLAVPAVGISSTLAMFPTGLNSPLATAIRINAFAFAAISAAAHLMILFGGKRAHQAKSWLLSGLIRIVLTIRVTHFGWKANRSRQRLMVYINDFAQLQEEAGEAFPLRTISKRLFDRATCDVVNTLVGRIVLVQDQDDDSSFSDTGKDRPKPSSGARPNGAAGKVFMVLLTVTLAGHAMAADAPDPLNGPAITAFMDNYTRGGKRPFLSDTGGKNCKTIAKMYAGALKRAGVHSSQIGQNIPSCAELSHSIKALTGDAPFWTGCIMLAFEPSRVEACLRGLVGARKAKPGDVDTPDHRLKTLEKGVRMAQANGKLPATWKTPDYHSLIVNKNSAACADYAPEATHVKDCLGQDLEPTGQTCGMVRAAYEGRLRLAYGGFLPHGYRALGCDQIAVNQLPTAAEKLATASEGQETNLAPAPPPPESPPVAHQAAVPANQQAFMKPLNELGKQLIPDAPGFASSPNIAAFSLPGQPERSLAVLASLLAVIGLIIWKWKKKPSGARKWR